MDLHNPRWLRAGILTLFAASSGWSQQAKIKEILMAAQKELHQNPAEAERQYKYALKEMEPDGSFEIERSIVFGLLADLYCTQARYDEAADSLERSAVTLFMLGRTGQIKVLESKFADLGLSTEHEQLLRAEAIAQAGKRPELVLSAPLFTCWSQLAARNEKVAQFLVGSLYEVGSGTVKQDLDAAIRLYRASAEQDFALAQTELGDAYLNGKGVGKDYVEARKWYEKAANQGLRRAQSQLGWLYDNGFGVGQDYDQAFKLYRAAAEQGDPSAQARLGWLFLQGLGVKADPVEAVTWFQKAALQGSVAGQVYMGTAYVKGIAVKQDDFEGVTWYRKAAEQGSADGQFNLGSMYEAGRGVKQDYKEAIRLYELAANQGNKDAMVNLGWMYENGEGLNKDRVKATALYFLAAERGDEGARSRMNNILRSMNSTETQSVRQQIDAWKATHNAL